MQQDDMVKQKVTIVRTRRYVTHWNATPFVYILRPMQNFIHQSQAGGIVLLVSTVLALLIANSPWGASYEAILATHVSLNAGPWSLDESVLHWVNDGLM